MSQDHVDMVRKGYEAFARRDLDAALDMMDPEIEAHDPPEVPDAAVHRGREAVRRDWEQTLELFEDLTIEVEEAVEARTAHVWTIRDGVAIRLRQYLDRAEALEAAGLARQEIP